MSFAAGLKPLKIETKINLTEDERPEFAKLKAIHEALTDSSQSIKHIHHTIQSIYDDKKEMKKDINTPFWMGNAYYTLCSDLVYNTSDEQRTIELLDMLISLGADINTYDTESGKIGRNTRDPYTSNTIAWAVSKGHPLIVKHLLKKGASKVDEEWVDFFGGHLDEDKLLEIKKAIHGTPKEAGHRSKRKTRKMRKSRKSRK